MSVEGAINADAVMRRWLRAGISGCLFVPRLAEANRYIIRYRTITGPVDQEMVSLVNGEMTSAANAAKAIVISFPLMRNSDDVAQLVRTLCNDALWGREELRASDGQSPGLRVALTWRTPSGLLSRAMGLAPLGTMPMMRRAPYVAICAWLGGHDNPCRQPSPDKPPRKVLLFSDMPHGMDLEDHNAKYTDSERLTAELSRQTGDATPGYKMTFCLDADVRNIIFA